MPLTLTPAQSWLARYLAAIDPAAARLPPNPLVITAAGRPSGLLPSVESLLALREEGRARGFLPAPDAEEPAAPVTDADLAAVGSGVTAARFYATAAALDELRPALAMAMPLLYSMRS